MSLAKYKQRTFTVTYETEDGFTISAEFKYPTTAEIRAEIEDDGEWLDRFVVEGPFVDGDKINHEDLSAQDTSDLLLKFVDFTQPRMQKN